MHIEVEHVMTFRSGEPNLQVKVENFHTPKSRLTVTEGESGDDITERVALLCKASMVDGWLPTAALGPHLITAEDVLKRLDSLLKA